MQTGKAACGPPQTDSATGWVPFLTSPDLRARIYRATISLCKQPTLVCDVFEGWVQPPYVRYVKAPGVIISGRRRARGAAGQPCSACLQWPEEDAPDADADAERRRLQSIAVVTLHRARGAPPAHTDNYRAHLEHFIIVILSHVRVTCCNPPALLLLTRYLQRWRQHQVETFI